MLRSSTIAECVNVTVTGSSHRLWFQSSSRINYRRLSHPLWSDNSAFGKWKRIKIGSNSNNKNNRFGMATATTAFTTRALAQPLQNADELIDSVETFIFDCDGMYCMPLIISFHF